MNNCKSNNNNLKKFTEVKYLCQAQLVRIRFDLFCKLTSAIN